MTSSMKYLYHDGIDMVFGVTAANTSYKSVAYHRTRRVPDKSLWDATVTPLEESQFFEEAEGANWVDEAGHWWGSENFGREVGSEGECCAFFPKRPNASDPAHGYPTPGHRHAYRAVPDQILRDWVHWKRIREVDRLRLKGGKL